LKVFSRLGRMLKSVKKQTPRLGDKVDQVLSLDLADLRCWLFDELNVPDYVTNEDHNQT